MYNVSFSLDFKRHTSSGKFIVIEGIDGSGKTTQAEMLVSLLKEQGKPVYVTKEPTDGLIGKLLRQVLSGEVPASRIAFQYLFAADRAVHQEEIEEHLEKGEIVISDRYFWSSIAYGMSDREGMDYHNAMEVSLVAQSILSIYNRFLIPDQTFYIDVPVDEALSRLQERKRTHEVYEEKEKLENIAKGYEWLVKEFPNEITRVEGNKTKEEVSKEIMSQINT